MHGRRVLLINPWIYDFAAYDLWAKPLGLLYIGALLRENGCRVELLDCLGPEGTAGRKPGGHGRFIRNKVPKPQQLISIPRHYARYGISPEAFIEKLKDIPVPDVILVTSMMTYWYPGVFEAIRLVKEHVPGVPVILGGVYATLCTDHARLFSGADHIITHEGEPDILKLLGELWGEPPEYVPDMAGLDSLPYPCFDLVPDLRYVCIRASRGCPYSCTYCASSYLCGRQRLRDAVKVADEIEFWGRHHGVSDFAFYDDALFTPHDHAQGLLEEIIARDLGARIHCPNGLHAREITGDMAVLMKKAGFSTIRLGLETTDAARQHATGAKVTNEEFAGAMESLHLAGYVPDDIGVYILCGLPGQDAAEVADSVRFVKAHGGRPRLSEYSPIPHTAEWEEAVRTSPYPIEDEPLFHNNTLLPCRSQRLTLSDYEALKHML